MKWEHTGTLSKDELSRMLRSMADALENSNEFQSFIGSTKLSMEASNQFSISVKLREDGNKYSFGMSLAWVKPSAKTTTSTKPTKPPLDEKEEVVSTIRGARRKKRPRLLGSKGKIPVPSTTPTNYLQNEAMPHETKDIPTPPTPPEPPSSEPMTIPEQTSFTSPEPSNPESMTMPEQIPPTPPEPSSELPPEPSSELPPEPTPITSTSESIPEPSSELPPEPTDWRKALDAEMESSGFIKTQPETPQSQSQSQPDLIKPTKIHERPITQSKTTYTMQYSNTLELVAGTYESAFTMKPESQWYELDLSDEQLESIKYKKLAEEIIQNTTKEEQPKQAKRHSQSTTKPQKPIQPTAKKQDEKDIDDLFGELDEEPKSKKKAKTSGIDESSHLVKPSEFLKRKNK